MNTVTLDASPTGTQLHRVSSCTHHSQTSSVSTSSTVTTNVNAIDLKRNLLETVIIPLYFVPVIIAAFGVINLTICCLIWIRRTNSSGMEPDRRHELEKCDTDLYLTPIATERPLSMTLRNNVRAGNTNTAQNAQFDYNLRLLHRTESLCMDGYEVIDISSTEDLQNASYNEQSIYESTQTINTPFQDTSGYLTVLGVMETPV